MSENTWKKSSCSSQEAKFLLSKIESFTVPHFYIIWKILKKPIVGRPIVAGYNHDWRQQRWKTFLYHKKERVRKRHSTRIKLCGLFIYDVST